MAVGRIPFNIQALTMSPQATKVQIERRSLSATKPTAPDPRAFAIRALPGHDLVAVTEDLLTENDQLLRLIDCDIDTVDITLHIHPHTRGSTSRVHDPRTGCISQSCPSPLPPKARRGHPARLPPPSHTRPLPRLRALESVG